jgi:trk system potassium uptake protein
LFHSLAGLGFQGLLGIWFGVLILGGTILCMLPWSQAAGTDLDILDALFTATSACCVTGLVVVDTGRDFSL